MAVKETTVKEEAADGGEMTVRGHLKELRNRLIICILVFIVGFIICFYFAGNLIKVLTDMGTQYGYEYVYLAPQELLMEYFNVGLIGGLILDIPVIATEAYQFSVPALDKKGRRAFFWSLVFGGICFIIGILFAYFVTVPFMLHFLISFSGQTTIKASISIQQFLSFVITVFIIFGCIFEMPVVSVLLARLGILKPEWLKKGQKVAVVLIFVVAAIITPPDISSQILVAIPMIALYELSIWLTSMLYKKKSETDEE